MHIYVYIYIQSKGLPDPTVMCHRIIYTYSHIYLYVYICVDPVQRTCKSHRDAP